ncbi:MAG: RIP metalloprotease RseP [Pseudomonadota bacterium]
MSVIQMILAFLLAIGPLILFHELGHYTVARLCGVKVLRFSIGMGKIVWSRKVGPDQTEWAISALPLGGYVKFLDNRDPSTAAKTEADAAREFTHQSVWRRIAIVAAGPLANFILAIAVFAGLFMYGVPDAATLVRAMPESAAVYQAGLREGHRITGVNGVPVAAWSELRFEILKAALDKGEIRLDVTEKSGAHFVATIPVQVTAGLNVDGDVLGELGLEMQRAPVVIVDVIKHGAAERAGLTAGDQIVTIDGKPVRDGGDFVAMIQASRGSAMSVSLLRAGAPLALVLTPDLDPVSKQLKIQSHYSSAPEQVTLAIGPFRAIAKAAVSTWDQALMQLKMIGKIISGALPWKNVTGIITIADYAAQTAKAGPIVFLSFIAMISVSLGVMNLLPIPVLDGGLLLYYSLEVLTGRPLPERIVDYAQRAGVVLLVMLMSLALFNDVVRQL